MLSKSKINGKNKYKKTIYVFAHNNTQVYLFDRSARLVRLIPVGRSAGPPVRILPVAQTIDGRNTVPIARPY